MMMMMMMVTMIMIQIILTFDVLSSGLLIHSSN